MVADSYSPQDPMSEVEPLRGELVELLPRLRRFARTLTRSAHDADDLVQSALERALSRAHQHRADAPLASWMFGIVRNAWIDEVRSRSRRARHLAPAELGEEVADDSGSPAGSTEVEDALARLPDEQRLAVSLVLIEGLSYKEAAEIMEVPMGTLTSRLARAREALQRLLGEPTGASV